MNELGNDTKHKSNVNLKKIYLNFFAIYSNINKIMTITLSQYTHNH